MPNKLIHKISPPLIIAPLFDTRMLKDFEKKHRNQDEASRAADRIIRKYLTSRQWDFQRSDEAITM